MAGKIVVSTLNNDTGVLATQNGMTGIAKAWASWTYNGSVITASNIFNVSSIIRSSAGIYTINFTTAMPSSLYPVASIATMVGTETSRVAMLNGSAALSTSSATLSFMNGINAVFYDPPLAAVIIYS
jgi:hypothetical protein